MRGAGLLWLTASALAPVPLVAGCGILHHARADEQSLPACARQAGETRPPRDPVARCLERGDALFQRRAEPGLLDQAMQIWLEALTLAPEDPRTLARMTRGYATSAYATGSPQSYATAREYGLRCLSAGAEFHGVVEGAGGLLNDHAIAVIPVDGALCARWTSLAWARWAEAQGVAGVAIDLKNIQGLAARALSLAPDAEDGMAHAVLGLALAIPPAPLTPDLGAAERELLAAIDAAPGRLTPVVDLAMLVYAPHGDADAWRGALSKVVGATLPPDDPYLLENRRAQTDATAALAVGMPDAAAWWKTPSQAPAAR